MNELSVIVITLNEEKNIRNCLESVKWADEIIVVDAGSNDNTVVLCAEYTQKIFFNEWKDFSSQKKYAFSLASKPWVLNIDADERIPHGLKTEIKSLLANRPANDGYLIPRKSYFLGKWIKRCGWYPGHQLRLFLKAHTKVSESRVHEGFLVDGKVGRVDAAIEHFSYPTLSDNLKKLNHYTTLEAQDKVSLKKIHWWDFLTHPLSEFLRKYFSLLGILDGFHGFLVSWYSAFSKMILYMKLWDLSRGANGDDHHSFVNMAKRAGKSPLSVIVITHNEERNIFDCLESVKWANEIVIVDSNSTDRTREIAKAYTKNIFRTDWKGYAANKNYGLERCTCEWVLWIDADERVSPELAIEIQDRLDKNPHENGFEMPRKAFFLGKFIKHCGWYPGYVLRLFRRGSGQFTQNLVHESVQLNGHRARLRGPLLHYTDANLEHYLSKFDKYTALAAKELFVKNRRINGIAIALRGLHAFLKMYIFRLGFLDGTIGLMLCLLSGGYVFTKYAKLWELNNVNYKQADNS